MANRDYRAALRELLKLADLTWHESDALLKAMASLHDEIKELLNTGQYSQTEINRLQASLETILIEHTEEMVLDARASQQRAWARGVQGFEDLMKTTEIRWKPGLTGREDELVKQFLTVDRIRGVTEEIKNAVRAEVMNGVFMKRTPFQVMQSITNVIGIRDMRGFRQIGTTGVSAKAERIMRTELMTIQSAASWTEMTRAAQDLPDLKHTWLSTGDSRTRATHLAAHGQTVGIGEEFLVGGELARFPRDPNLSPENRINCRCDAVPYRDEWGAVEDLIGPLTKQVEKEKEQRNKEALWRIIRRWSPAGVLRSGRIQTRTGR